MFFLFFQFFQFFQLFNSYDNNEPVHTFSFTKKLKVIEPNNYLRLISSFFIQLIMRNVSIIWKHPLFQFSEEVASWNGSYNLITCSHKYEFRNFQLPSLFYDWILAQVLFSIAQIVPKLFPVRSNWPIISYHH